MEEYLGIECHSAGMNIADAAAGTMKNILRTLADLTTVAADNPALLKAQHRAISRQMPMMYFILIANTWAVAITHVPTAAPIWLTVMIPAVFTVICAVRSLHWFRSATKDVPPETALKEMVRTNCLAAAISIMFTAWSFALMPYGDAYAQSHVAFYMAITVISCIFCLMYLRSAAIAVTAVVNGAFILFFASTGQPTFVAISVNILLVCGGMLAVLMINYQNFARMISAQERTQALSDENLRLANLDSLTDLPNRRAYFAYLAQALNAARTAGRRLAVGIVDLDGFKPVNDLYGHSTGDRLLIAVGERLRTLAQGRDIYVARLGGDEFAFVIRNAPGDEEILACGNAICAVLEAPFELSEATVVISGSIGLSAFPDTALTPEQLFDQADYALYQSKRANRAASTLFSTNHSDQIHRDAHVEQALKRADLDEELSVVFQPIVNIKTGATIGFEALARWTSPLLGPVSPAAFMPVAERAGIVQALTRHLLKKALAVAATWPDHARLAFNLSAHDLNSAEDMLALLAIIRKSDFDPSRLDMEITETAFAHDFDQVRKSIDMLRLLGCGVSLDDFGTGYSSLAQLHALPLTKIKIDRSFVTDLHNTPASYKIVKSLLTLSHDMGLGCVIEGIENKEELTAVAQLGGEMAQGYFYSPPLAAGATHAMFPKATPATAISAAS